MANSQTSSGNTVTRYLSDFYQEYVRSNRFSRYTGTNSNNIIHAREERVTGRQSISIPLVTRLKGSATVGSATLRGNGEAVGNYNMLLTPTYRRHAVEFDKEELDKPAFDMKAAGRPLLMTWSMEDHRDQIIQAFAAVNQAGTYVNVDDATAAQRNAWNVAQQASGRVLYGATTGNYNATFATALATVDGSADKLDTDIISELSDMAKTADPHVRPIRTTDDEEYFVLLVGSRSMRHLRSDSVMQQANREARERGMRNPLFMGGDLVWENVIIHEVPEITTTFTDNAASLFNTAGTLSTKVEPIFLCGQQALGWGIGKRPNVVEDNTYDYGFQPGVAVEKKEIVNKAFFATGASDAYVQHGIVSGFVSGES